MYSPFFQREYANPKLTIDPRNGMNLRNLPILPPTVLMIPLNIFPRNPPPPLNTLLTTFVIDPNALKTVLPILVKNLTILLALKKALILPITLVSPKNLNSLPNLNALNIFANALSLKTAFAMKSPNGPNMPCRC